MRKYPLSLLKDKNIVTFFDFWGKTRRGEKDGGDGNDSNLLIVFYVQIMPDDFVM
uniref:hypothetical protein n=1 Tax=Escherichia coli TaxID=562 RepID=UPI003CC7CE51